MFYFQCLDILNYILNRSKRDRSTYFHVLLNWRFTIFPKYWQDQRFWLTKTSSYLEIISKSPRSYLNQFLHETVTYPDFIYKPYFWNSTLPLLFSQINFINWKVLCKSISVRLQVEVTIKLSIPSFFLLQ
jgi:hypothetical protein